MKTKIKWLVLFLLVLPQYVLAAEHTAVEEAPLPNAQVLESRELFMAAWQNYTYGRATLAEPVRSNSLAEAIATISKAVALEPKNVDYLVLASQIYRSKGGLADAKNYFSRAEDALTEKLAANPNDIGAHLDYAILCTAGDARYWKDSAVYKKKAIPHADKVIELCAKNHDGIKSGSRNIRAAAMAYIVKGDAKRAAKMLKKASELDATGAFYYRLYTETVDSKKWLWETKSHDKEFLLYCMADSSRNANLQ